MMNKNKSNFLTSNQLAFLTMGFVVGPALLRLPNALIPVSGQDAWISAIIALVYPLYVVLISIYIINKHPKQNILMISKKYFGNIFGNFLNFIFMLQYILLTGTITVEFINRSRVYTVPFLTPIKIIIVAMLLGLYGAYKGIKCLGKINEIITYGFLIMLLSLSALRYGSMLNIRPVFGSGLSNIFKATPKTAYFYIGWETILLFHPLVQNTKDIKKSVLKALGIASIIWVWTVFITIFYLGIDVATRSYWPVILVFESINIPIINNFRYIFMFVWDLMVLRMTANFYYASTFCLNNFIKIDIKKIMIVIFPIMIYLTVKLTDNILKDEILSVASPFFVIFNLIFLTLIAILSKINP